MLPMKIERWRSFSVTNESKAYSHQSDRSDVLPDKNSFLFAFSFELSSQVVGMGGWTAVTFSAQVVTL